MPNQDAASSYNPLLYSQFSYNEMLIQRCKIWIEWQDYTSIHWNYCEIHQISTSKFIIVLRYLMCICVCVCVYIYIYIYIYIYTENIFVKKIIVPIRNFWIIYICISNSVSIESITSWPGCLQLEYQCPLLWIRQRVQILY